MKKLKTIGLISLALILWTAFIALGFVDGYLLKSIDSSGTTKGFAEAVSNQIEDEYIGNLAMALVKDGKVSETLFHSDSGEDINGQSAFPVASVSKWVTAVGVMKLVEDQKLDLDAPVENYLTRWNLPASEFDNDQVTVRRLLSHSAGFDDDLGYGGFTADEEVQSLEESLTSAADAYYDGAKARVGYEPGSQFMYSGASYTLLQLLIEEVTGASFSDYISQAVFNPLGMNNSSFNLRDSSSINLVNVYKTNGSTRPMNRFTAKAAASLMTSLDDLSKFMLSNSLDNHSLLKSSTIQLMAKAESYRNGIPYYGLGPDLYSPQHETANIIGHDGSGNDAINATARFDLASQDGIIILSTGHYSFASDTADEWLFWKAGIADRVVMQRNIPYLVTLLVVGYVLIVILSWLILKRRRANT